MGKYRSAVAVMLFGVAVVGSLWLFACVAAEPGPGGDDPPTDWACVLPAFWLTIAGVAGGAALLRAKRE